MNTLQNNLIEQGFSEEEADVLTEFLDLTELAVGGDVDAQMKLAVAQSEKQTLAQIFRNNGYQPIAEAIEQTDNYAKTLQSLMRKPPMFFTEDLQKQLVTKSIQSRAR